MARAGLTKRRLLGIDRSGPPPQPTLRGQPLNPWTVPNLIGFTRIAFVPVFLTIALESGDGRVAAATILYALIAGTDYLDGIAARVTGQYSRLGALIDPLTDRLLVVAGVIVTYRFELLPRWALLALAGRELFMLALTQLALRRGRDLQINLLGRWAVWPTMLSILLAMVSATWVADALLYLGLSMSLGATALYLRDGVHSLRAPSTSA